jgi:alpha-L-fucosidase
MTVQGDRELPRWFDDAKFGIFIHWTAAAIPAFAPVGPSPFDLAETEGWEASFARSPYVEWYQNSLAIEGSPVARHHAEHYGDQPYETFVREFRRITESVDIERWADLCEAAGAKYVVLVTKHHDGFLLWPSAHPNPHRPDWQTARDVVGELARAVRARGMRFGTYYSGGLDWTFGGLPITDVRSMIAAIPQSDEYIAYADAHWRELVERYEPCVLWNDIGYPARADMETLFNDYFERVPDGVVNNRFDFLRQTAGDLHADFLTPEYSTDAPVGRKWEACRGIGTSFGFNREERAEDYLDGTALVGLLVDVVARGGNMLLNLGPTGAGDVPWLQASAVTTLGWWLAVNGEAVHGTRPWSRSVGTTDDGIDVRYTASDDADAVYAIVLGTPIRNEVVLDVALDARAAAAMIGWRGSLQHERVDRGTRVALPEVPADGPALALRITPQSAVTA